MVPIRSTTPWPIQSCISATYELDPTNARRVSKCPGLPPSILGYDQPGYRDNAVPTVEGMIIRLKTCEDTDQSTSIPHSQTLLLGNH
jgi:hypothetical protein